MTNIESAGVDELGTNEIWGGNGDVGCCWENGWGKMIHMVEGPLNERYLQEGYFSF